MRELITRLMEFTGDGVYRYKLDDGRLLLANQGLARILDLDCEPDALVGRYLKDLLIYTEPEGTIRSLLKEGHGEIHGYLYGFKTLKGEDKWVIHDAFLTNEPVSGIQVVETVVKDITPLKRAEAALAQEKERLAITLQSIGDGVIATDIQGRITLVNEAASELTGWSEKEAVGRPLTEVFRIVDERTRRPCDDPVKQVLQTGKRVGLANHTALIAIDGTVRSIADSGTPIHDNQGHIKGVVLVFRDVTEQRKLTEELSRANQELETLIRIASHDLRSPLVNIQGFSQLLNKAYGATDRILAEAVLPDETRQTLAASREKAEKSIRFINAGVEKMSGLISGLLRLSRLGRAPLVLQPLDMNALLNTVAEAMTFQIRAAAAEITVETLPDCRADAALINQVFSNLLDNAIKYRDPARPLRVRIWGRRPGWDRREKEAHTLYCVEDNGVGVAPEHRQKIWSLFYRPNPRANDTGEGVGLTAVQRIVERHGGTVWMESEVGQGSRFFLTLPADEKEAKPPASHRDAKTVAV
ncbi:MAG: PAS domain S-box protein [Kiritimatiellia bacterium]|jgi:PAS domain S-box-containing protein